MVVLIDALRGSRKVAKEVKSPNVVEYISSITLLWPLQKKFQTRVKLYFYHTPKLSGWLKTLIPQKFNELVGVHHIKCYIIDKDILISGANLSQQYFTNRQDRYMWIYDSPQIVDFYSNLISIIGGFSYYLKSDSEFEFPTNVPSPVNSPTEFQTHVKGLLKTIINPLQNISNFENMSRLLSENDTWIFPTIQLGQCDFNHDRDVTNAILSHSPSKNGQTIYMTSPYFNFTEEYKKSLLKGSNNKKNIIVASPQANGFYNGGNIIGLVPWAYNSLLETFYSSLTVEDQINIFEYSKNDWTFHSKGIWLEIDDQNFSHKKFGFTLIGSSNFGIRSVERDLESQIAIFTINPTLLQSFIEERKNIFKNSQNVDSTTFNNRRGNNSWIIPFLIPFANKFM